MMIVLKKNSWFITLSLYLFISCCRFYPVGFFQGTEGRFNITFRILDIEMQ